MFNPAHFHPLMVHFPVALIIAGFFTEVLSLFLHKKAPWLTKASFYLMILGTLGAVAGYLTGEFFTDEYSGPLGELKETHELFAKITMFVMIAASLIGIYLVWKKKEQSGLKWAVTILYFIAALSVGYTGWLGGSMVYDHMIGIQDSVVNTSIDSTKKLNATGENLKAALQGETNASAKYAAFADKATEENLPQIAVLFKAASKSESIHAANHKKVLEGMGVKVDVKPQAFDVKSTKENLDAAYAGEKHEVENMYQGYIDQADADDNDKAVKSFGYAFETEKKHMILYKTAIDALATNKVNTLTAEYFVCPTCGYTYTKKDVVNECIVCSTPKEKFVSFK